MTVTYTTPTGSTYNFFTDVLKQNHTLVAGATGSGKSVVINGLIATILYRLPGNSVGRATMILVDPKRVELAQYKNLPHTLYHAAGQNPSEWKTALEMACRIMDRRYDEMERAGRREYTGGDLYVIIDEWASINSKMNPLRNACVAPLLRLVSEGRAAHVHVILATQVPKATVIPTEIRDNFTCRIALMTENKLQSRIIIDQPGCELFPSPKKAGYALGWYCLPGNDRTLYKMPYVPETELDRLVKWWEDQIRQNTPAEPEKPAKPARRGLFGKLFG